MADVGRMLVVIGIVAVAVGALLAWGPRIPWLGRLPGDVTIERGPVTIHLPIGTCIVLSVILSVLFGTFWRR